MEMVFSSIIIRPLLLGRFMNNCSDVTQTAEIISDMSFLYELSLSIGRSLDLVDNCEKFLKILMPRKNYSYGAIWIKDKYLSNLSETENTTLIYAKPKYYIRDTEMPLSHPLFTEVAGRDYVTISSRNKKFSSFINEHNIKEGAFVILPLGQLGVLKIYTANKDYIYDDRTARQMRSVLDKFAISLEGCLSHENLIAEIRQRRQTETELKKAREELETRVQERTRELVALNQDLLTEVIERKKTESSLRQLQAQYQALVENNPDIIMRFDKELRCLYANPAIKFVTGKLAEDVIGKYIWDMGFGIEKSETLQKHLLSVIESGEQLSFESEQVHSPGVRYYQAHFVPEFDNNRAVVSVLGIGRDVTEHKLFEKEIARLDRLGLVGQMAASIGHEVRNPMTTVRGYLQLYQRKLTSEKDSKTFSIMIEEIDRANAIITEFLSLARNKAVDLKKNNLNEIIKVILPLIQADALHRGNSINVEFGKIFDLRLDEKEIRQCILNLVRNALEAMPDGGAVTIKTYIENEGVVLSISDEGKGLDSSTLDRLGTPFFTTKENGTGLGLPVCYSIVARHKAKIDVETGSSGTIFYVRFAP